MDSNVRKILEKINIRGELKKDELMSSHTTFKTGGPAEFFFIPRSLEDLKAILSFCRDYKVPYFILGGGANILVSDRGINGIVIDMRHFNRIGFRDTICYAESGTSISQTAEQAGGKGFSGFEFIYAMPGTVGGAIWMNARCYGSSLSDILYSVDYLDENLSLKKLTREMILETSGYKKSVFQTLGGIILKGEFLLKKGDKETIKDLMAVHKKDREDKGHFLFPSAGSIFKNNRDFGEPTGIIIESLGLKGRSIGGAQIASFHGNIIINKGTATSRNIRDLIEICEHEVQQKRGILLEREVQYVGTWQ